MEHLSEEAPPDPHVLFARGLPLIDDPATLDDGLRLLRSAVGRTPHNDRARPFRLLNLGVAVDNRWQRDGDPADLDEAIDLYRQAAPDAGVRRACLTNLCYALRMRYRLTGARADLDAAVEAGADCLAAVPGDDDRRADRLEQAAHARRERYEVTRDLGDLRIALDLYREAVALTTSPGGGDPTGRALVHLRNYHLVSREHHTATGDERSAATAITTALRLAGDPLGAGAVQWAARRLIDGAEPDGPSRAAAALRRAAALAEGTDATTLRLDLVTALRRHADQTRRPEDAESAVSAAYDAVEQAAAEDRPAALGVLGAAQLCLHQHTGAIADLDAAIGNLREADRTQKGAGPAGPANLSVALQCRYEYFEELADLDEAVAASRRAAALTGVDSADSAGCAMNLSRVLRFRYERFGRTEDIDEAIAVLHSARTAVDPGSPLSAMAAANLGILHRVRFQRLREPADIEEAIRYTRSALTAFRARPGGPGSVGSELINLALALTDSHRSLGLPEALDEAAEAAAQAVPLLSAAEAVLRGKAAVPFAERFRRDGRESDARTAIAHLGEMAAHPLVQPHDRVDAAIMWGRLAEDLGDREAAYAGFAQAVEMLTRLSFLGTSRRARQRSLTLVRGLAGDVGAAALDIGEAATAVARLEQGRGVMWAQQLELRSDLTQLASRDAVLAARMEAVAVSLGADQLVHSRPEHVGQDWSETLGLLDDAMSATGDDAADRRVALARAAVAAAPPDLLAHASAVLEHQLSGRYLVRHDRADLDAAVAAASTAVRAAPVGAVGRYWSWYGRSLLRRYDADSERGRADPLDLDSAIRALQRAVAAGRSPRERTDDLAGLARAWERKGQVQDDVATLSSAVEAWRDVLRLGPGFASERAEWSSSLAQALLQRCDITGDLADLDDAIEAWGTATAIGGDDDDVVEWHVWLTVALRARWQARGDRADLDAALAAARLAEAYAAGLDQETQDVVRAALDEIRRAA
ncbi:hypothetical protein CS0771_44630 [Catellatospora sp. IY07-71]|uniref:hypothetical protein n=1 Tax=Catellatospora sp. IY07-71 TaxID=2728827 RepID=UPI001BB41059|nr:hypothetical protein [Catellatospora sp. IY07-71]BCJ74919.1 hypothetical protein CS0771_44630 [Catellatospora sp. IY07-71]